MRGRLRAPVAERCTSLGIWGVINSAFFIAFIENKVFLCFITISKRVGANVSGVALGSGLPASIEDESSLAVFVDESF